MKPTKASIRLGLYPAGEGAGYAGGILSAGVDGIRVAEAVGMNMARISVASQIIDGKGDARRFSAHY